MTDQEDRLLECRWGEGLPDTPTFLPPVPRATRTPANSWLTGFGAGFGCVGLIWWALVLVALIGYGKPYWVAWVMVSAFGAGVGLAVATVSTRRLRRKEQETDG